MFNDSFESGTVKGGFCGVGGVLVCVRTNLNTVKSIASEWG